MTYRSDDPRDAPRLILPFMRPLYDRVARPLVWVGLRVLLGLMLAIEGWPKIMAPFAQAGFLTGLGFHPGWLWSAILALLQVAGGLMIAAGFLTRPMALANALMLAVTWWFHTTHPYGNAILTPEGIAALGQNTALFTADGLRNLGQDGGAAFLKQVQGKAEHLSIFWTAAALVIAAWGAGPLSVDRSILRREF